MRVSKPTAGIVAALAVLLVTAPSASAASSCPAAGASASDAGRDVLVRATLCVLNRERARRDLRPLRLNTKLSAAARRHSTAMVRRRFFSHDSLSGASFVDRIRATGYLSGVQSWSLGENIAYGSGDRSSPRAIGVAWMKSPPHRANILSRSFREVGIGLAFGTPVGARGGTYTTDFGQRS